LGVRLSLFFTAENAENAEGVYFKTKGNNNKKLSTAENAENAEALMLKD